MIRLKEVHEWFRGLDSSTRIEFICSIVHLCYPWELRLLGSCLEHTARKNYHKLREFELKANDHTELQWVADQLQLEYKSQELRGKLITYFCLLSSKPNALCTRAVYTFLSVVDQLLRDKELHSTLDEKLIEDFRLLLTIAIHHPAFTFSQRQQLMSQMETFKQIFGTLVPPACHMTSTQCQTDDDLFLLPLQPSQSKEDMSESHHSQTLLYGSASVNDLQTEAASTVHISDLKLISTDRNSRHTIQVNTREGDSHTVTKTFSDISKFHTALLNYFPEDAKAPKNIRTIPLFGPSSKGRSEMIQDYLSGLCKMHSKYLNSQPVRDFLDLSSRDGSSWSPVSISVATSPSYVATQSVMVSSSDCTTAGSSNSVSHLHSKQSSPVSVSPLHSHSSAPTNTPPPHLPTTEESASSERIPDSQVGSNHAIMSPVSRSHSQTKHSLTTSSTHNAPNSTGQPPNHPIISQKPLYSHPITSYRQTPHSPITSQSPRPLASQTTTSAQPPPSVPPASIHPSRYQSGAEPRPSSPTRAVAAKGNLSTSRSNSSGPTSSHTSVYSFLKLLRLHKYSSHLRDISMEELLSMSKEELRKRGLVEGAARKLADELEKEKIKKKLSASRRADSIMSRSDSSGLLSSDRSHKADRLDRLDRGQGYSDSSNSDKCSPRTSPTASHSTPPPTVTRSPSDTDLQLSHSQRLVSSTMLNKFSDMSISTGKTGDGSTVSSSPDAVQSDQSHSSIEVSVLPDFLLHDPPVHHDPPIHHDPPVHHTTVTTSCPTQPITLEPALVPNLPPGFIPIYNQTVPPLNRPPYIPSQPDPPYAVIQDLPNHQASQQQPNLPVVITNPNPAVPIRDNSITSSSTIPSIVSPQTNLALPPVRGPSRPTSRDSSRSNAGGMRLKDGVKGPPTVEEVILKQQEEKAAQQRLNCMPSSPQPASPQQQKVLIRNPSIVETNGIQPKLHLPQNTLVITASRNAQTAPPISNHMSMSNYSSQRRDSDDATEYSDGRESIYSYTNRDPDDIEYMSERYEDCDIPHSREAMTGAPIIISSQSVPPAHMQQSLDGEFYIPQPMNGFKPGGVVFQSPADMERITFVPHHEGVGFGTPCPCATCSIPPYLMAPGTIHHPGTVPAPPPGSIPPPPPPPPPPGGQNGFISHAGFIPGGFVPTSNGLISSDIPPFSRRPPINNVGGPLLARADMVYHPVSFVVQPGRAAYPQPFHPPLAKPVYCSNCGDNTHTSVDCREPPDTTDSINQYSLDMQPDALDG